MTYREIREEVSRCSFLRRPGDFSYRVDSSGLDLEDSGKVLGALTPRHETCKPRAVRSRKGYACLVPVALVGVDASDEYLVLENDLCRVVPGGGPGSPTRHYQRQ